MIQRRQSKLHAWGLEMSGHTRNSATCSADIGFIKPFGRHTVYLTFAAIQLAGIESPSMTGWLHQRVTVLK